MSKKNKLFEEFLKTPEGQAWKEKAENTYFSFIPEYFERDDLQGEYTGDEYSPEFLDLDELIDAVTEDLRRGSEEISDADDLDLDEDEDEEEDDEEDEEDGSLGDLGYDMERNAIKINILLYNRITEIFEELGLYPYIEDIHLDDCTALEFFVDVNNQASPLRCLFYINDDLTRDEYIFVANSYLISDLYAENVKGSGLFDIYCQEVLDNISAVNPFNEPVESVLAQDEQMNNMVFITRISKMAKDLKKAIMEGIMSAVFTFRYFGPSIMALYDGRLVEKDDIIYSGLDYLKSCTTQEPVYPWDELMDYLKPTPVDPDYVSIEMLVKLYQQMNGEE